MMIDANSRVTMVDFGLAVQVAPGQELHDSCGTVPFAAPEAQHRLRRYFETNMKQIDEIQLLSRQETPNSVGGKRILHYNMDDDGHEEHDDGEEEEEDDHEDEDEDEDEDDDDDYDDDDDDDEDEDEDERVRMRG